MRNLAWLLSLTLLWLSAASAFARDLNPNYDPAAAARRNRGVVAVSMTMSVHDDTEHWDSATFTLWYQKIDGAIPRWISMPRDNRARRNSPSEFSNEYGQLRVIELDAGDYEFSSFTYRGYNSHESAWDMAPLRFTVRPGRATYLGRVHLDEFIMRSEAVEYTFGFFGWPRFLDARDEDLATLATRYPRLTNELVDFGNTDPGAWTRTWVREAACLTLATVTAFRVTNAAEALIAAEQRPARFGAWNAYRAAQPDGVFAWQRDFREFALMLSGCSRVRLGPQPTLGTLLWSLKSADVRWEGVVREISVGGDAITLALDTQTSDVRVAATTRVDCCVVYGEFESWRTVQIGDTIAVHGTLDPEMPLKFSLPTTPVIPVLRNARAEVLRRP